MTVAVLEGLVRIDDDRAVRAERIPPGHRRSYAPTGELGPDEAIDVSEVSAWREGRLRFKATPLAEVAAELERYHQVRFIFADPRLRSVPLSGTFDSEGRGERLGRHGEVGAPWRRHRRSLSG